MNHQQTEAGSTEGPATLLRPFVGSLQDFFLILKNMTFTYCLPDTFVFVFHLSSLLRSFRNTLHTMLRYSKLWAKIQGLHWKRVKKQPLFKEGWLKLHSTVNYNSRESNIFYCASCVSFKKHVHCTELMINGVNRTDQKKQIFRKYPEYSTRYNRGGQYVLFCFFQKNMLIVIDGPHIKQITWNKTHT